LAPRDIVFLDDWLVEFERLHSQVFRTVAMVPIGIVIGSPAIGSPRSMPPRKLWKGWKPGRYATSWIGRTEAPKHPGQSWLGGGRRVRGRGLSC
jgi:hypothetical protein